MTNAAALALDYVRRARLRVRAVEALILAGDFADAVRESQESVELAVKAVLKLKGLSYPRAHDVARLLRDPAIAGPLLTPEIFVTTRRPLVLDELVEPDDRQGHMRTAIRSQRLCDMLRPCFQET